MSVTYGAGGGTSKVTADIASRLLEKGVTPLAHLSCISSTKADIKALLSDLRERAIENILALRGDIPQDASFPIRVEFSIEFFCLAISFAFLDASRTFAAPKALSNILDKILQDFLFEKNSFKPVITTLSTAGLA